MEDELDLLPMLPSHIVLEARPLSEIPVRIQGIFCLLACGFSTNAVAELTKTSHANINTLVRRYDPERKFYLTPNERRRFIAQLWEARAAEALLRVTPEKMEALDAVDLIKIADVATQRSDMGHEAEKPKDPYEILRTLGVLSSHLDGVGTKPPLLEEATTMPVPA